jgi:beta-xylosidase
MKQYTQNNFLAYLLILMTFFVILFFTKNIYIDMQVQLDTKEQYSTQLSEKQSELSRLNQLKKSLNQE